MPNASRKGDNCTGHGCFPSRPSVTGSGNVLVNSIPALRVTDSYAPHGCGVCAPHGGQLAKGAPGTYINSLQAGRIGDPVNCGSKVLVGSANVFIGNAGASSASAMAAPKSDQVQTLIRASKNGEPFAEICPERQPESVPSPSPESPQTSPSQQPQQGPSSPAPVEPAPGETSEETQQPTTPEQKEVVDIIVLFAGTVDPFNIDAEKRANSYQGENWYWENNPKLIDKLQEFRQEYHELHVFPFHGWSGDNLAKNRKIAGSYLADRLSGGNGQQPYYPKFLEREVSFHLIGHSHGGNLINEFSNRIANSPNWPEQWKIKSITYLSTPFFQKLHQVNTSQFHPDSKIINVFNRYDLTQRVIADFSLEPLSKALAIFASNKFGDLFQEILRFDVQTLQALLVLPRDVDESFWGVDWQWQMEPAAGERLYEECLELFNNLLAFLQEAENLLQQLNSEVNYPVDEELQGKVSQTRKLMSDALYQRFSGTLQKIKTPLLTTIQAFENRQEQGVYPVREFFEDLHINDFVVPLLEIIAIDPNTLQGPLANLLHDVVAEQIEHYDNTSHTPQQQLANSPYQDSIIDVDVSEHDPYYGKKDTEFNKLLQQLELSEERYQQTQSNQDLLNMIFTLIAQWEMVEPNIARLAALSTTLKYFLRAWNTFDGWAGRENTAFESNLQSLQQILSSYHTILQSRNAGGIRVAPSGGSQQQGSLIYLLKTSHSTSRMDLYPEVAQVIEEQIDTPRTSEMSSQK